MNAAGVVSKMLYGVQVCAMGKGKQECLQNLLLCQMVWVLYNNGPGL
jgi:hypothetical protein